MGEPQKSLTAVCASYSFFNGSNVTAAGLEGRLAKDKVYGAIFVGGSTDFRGNENFVGDIKAGMTYDDSNLLNQNLRIRTMLGDNNSVQVRYSPLSLNVPVGKNTSLYANPHYSGKVNLDNGEWQHSAGIFVGATQKLGNKTALSFEVQRYNLQDIKNNSGQNWSANLILSHNF